MPRILSMVALLAVVIASSMLALSGGAVAHEGRRIGPYEVVVGWLDEPAYLGRPNAATVRVHDTRSDPETPVEGLEKTLKLAVIQGGLAPFSGSLRAMRGQPGLYALDISPTVSGAYRYRLTGTIGDTSVDETFESGPTTFGDVLDASALQYPTKVPAGDDLAGRLDAAQTAAEQARGWAIAAFVLALLAFISATNAYRLARRRA